MERWENCEITYAGDALIAIAIKPTGPETLLRMEPPPEVKKIRKELERESAILEFYRAASQQMTAILGEQGWELVNVHSGGIVRYFKRQVQEP